MRTRVASGGSTRQPASRAPVATPRRRNTVLHEGHEPESIADLGDTDVLPCQGMTEIDLPTLEADPPAVGDREGRVVERVGQVLQGCLESQNGPEIDDFRPVFIGTLVGVGSRMTVLGPRLGTLLGTLETMPMCAYRAHVVLR